MRRIVLTAGIACGVILVVIVLTSSLFVQKSSAAIVVDATLPEVPSEMYILESQPFGMTGEQAANIASEVFNVTGELTREDGAWIIRTDQVEFSIYESGSIKFFDRPKMFGSGYFLETVPSDAECMRIAERFLEKLAAYGVSAGDLQFSFEDIAEDMTVAASLVNGSQKTMINNVHVNFALSYNNISVRVRGSEAEIRVYLGKEGEVIGFIGDFWKVEATRKQAILTPMQAIEKMREVGYGAYMPRGLVSNATVKTIELAYFASSPEARNVMLVPAYYISGELVGEDGSTGELLQVVFAAN